MVVVAPASRQSNDQSTMAGGGKAAPIVIHRGAKPPHWRNCWPLMKVTENESAEFSLDFATDCGELTCLWAQQPPADLVRNW